MLKPRHFTISREELAHFDFDGSNTSKKKSWNGATNRWKSNWHKSKTNGGAFDS